MMKVRFFERNLWLSALLLGVLAGLLLLALLELGGGLPALPPLQERPQPLPKWQAEGRLEELFPSAATARFLPGTNAVNPFFTLYFQPQPPPPPPATKKVELLYQGCLISSLGSKLAYVKIGDASLILTNGARVIADHGIKEIAVRALTLTNAAGQTNLLQFNVKTALDVPAT